MSAVLPLIDPISFTLPNHNDPEYAPLINILTGTGLSLDDAVKGEG